MKPGELKPTLGLLAPLNRVLLVAHVEDAGKEARQPVRAVGELLGVLRTDGMEMLRKGDGKADMLLQGRDDGFGFEQTDIGVGEIRPELRDPGLRDRNPHRVRRGSGAGRWRPRR